MESGGVGDRETGRRRDKDFFNKAKEAVSEREQPLLVSLLLVIQLPDELWPYHVYKHNGHLFLQKN